MEGYQRAYTLCITQACAGVVWQLRREQGGDAPQHGLCPRATLGRLMPLMRYLCENGVGLGHWPEVLDDAGVAYWPCMAAGGRSAKRKTHDLWHLLVLRAKLGAYYAIDTKRLKAYSISRFRRTFSFWAKNYKGKVCKMYQDEYKRWLAAELEDADLKPELDKIRADDAEIKDRFAVALKFGTAGLRGVLGAGTNRMNIYVVRQATQGLGKLGQDPGRQPDRGHQL